MPEFPDVCVYVERLNALTEGQRLKRVRLKSSFVLRTYEPPLSSVDGKLMRGAERLGKRLVFALEDELYLVLHLMIAGRLRRREPGGKIPGKIGLAALDFEEQSFVLTEASSKKRASLHLVRGREALGAFDRGGIEPLKSELNEFRSSVGSENRTLKRALTDPRLLSGVGNAYSDEILWEAKLSPVKRTSGLTSDEWKTLHQATITTLTTWTERLRAQVGDGFPDKVTAFHPEMAVHGRFGKSCRRCTTKIQRIRYAERELNYCPMCQTKNKLLADRSLSRLLKGDWPKTLDELEERKAPKETSAPPREPKTTKKVVQGKT